MPAKISAMLSKSLTIFIVVVVLSLIVITLSVYYVDSLKRERDASKRAMFLWETKINASEVNNQIIDENETNFVSLVKKGVVGEEDRLSWFETLQNTAKKRGMPSVKYSISSKKLLVNNKKTQSYKGINIYKSLMILDIEMAHEGDLFALLNNLKKSSGLYTVEKCTIKKSSAKIITNSQMQAYCELAWYTLMAKK